MMQRKEGAPNVSTEGDALYNFSFHQESFLWNGKKWNPNNRKFGDFLWKEKETGYY